MASGWSGADLRSRSEVEPRGGETARNGRRSWFAHRLQGRTATRTRSALSGRSSGVSRARRARCVPKFSRRDLPHVEFKESAGLPYRMHFSYFTQVSGEAELPAHSAAALVAFTGPRDSSGFEGIWMPRLVFHLMAIRAEMKLCRRVGRIVRKQVESVEHEEHTNRRCARHTEAEKH